MPNWMFNDLYIEGSAKDIQKVKAQLNAPYTKKYEDGEEVFSNPIFSFWNIVRPPEDKLDEYAGVHGFDGEKRLGDSEFNWYNFNNRAWGTKWDVGVRDEESYTETQLISEEETKLHYYFHTAWGAPLAAIEALSVQHPELEITLKYEEEQGWGGEIYWNSGGSTIIDQWDIPESHEDFVSRDNADGCKCSYEEDSEEWFEDCPRDKPIELYAKKDVVKVTEKIS